MLTQMVKVARITAIVLLVGTEVAWAQTPGWAVATWKGRLLNNRVEAGGPDRFLIVLADGRCGWGNSLNDATSMVGKIVCSITQREIKLNAPDGSHVRLQPNSGSLKGEYIPYHGRDYFLTMIKQ